MAIDRIEQLQKYCDEDPDDPFNLYALAIEYLRTDTAKSMSLFENLLVNHPDYLPTYYHVAKLYQDLGQKEKAMAVYENGISLARKSNNAKALRELQSAYDEMLFE